MCTGGSPLSKLSGASRGEQKGSLTTGERSTLISVSCSVRRGWKPRGNSREDSSSAPSPLAGAAMATADMSMDVGVSGFLEKTATSSCYDPKRYLDVVSSEQAGSSIEMIRNRLKRSEAKHDSA